MGEEWALDWLDNARGACRIDIEGALHGSTKESLLAAGVGFAESEKGNSGHAK